MDLDGRSRIIGGTVDKVLSLVRISGHTFAKRADRHFPAPGQFAERPAIVLLLNTPDQLLVTRREQLRQ